MEEMPVTQGVNKTRKATVDDVEALVELTLLARDESPLTTQLCTTQTPHLSNLLGAWIGLEGAFLLVAEVDNTIVGFCLVQRVQPNLFSDVAFLQIEGLFVRKEFRRRGLARNLLTDVVRIAEAEDISHIVTIVLTGARQELRFLAGLGFAPAGARRIVDTPTLNRRLTSPHREGRMRGIDELIARRRRNKEREKAGL